MYSVFFRTAAEEEACDNENKEGGQKPACKATAYEAVRYCAIEIVTSIHDVKPCLRS